MVIVSVVRRRRTNDSSESVSKEVTLIFQQVVQDFQRVGVTKTDDQTARDWLEVVEEEAYSSPELLEFIRVYEQCRFQPMTSDLTKLRALRSLIPVNGPSKQ